MTDEIDFQKALSWLNEKWQGDKICWICGHNNWNVSTNVSEVREFGKGGLLVGGSVFPVLVVTCTTCGNSVLINAIMAGLVEIPKPSTEELEKPPGAKSDTAQGETS